LYNTNMENYKYIPAPGQLCQTFKGNDGVFPVVNSPESLVSDPLVEGELLLITKVVYHESLSSFYVEFLRDNKLYYTYFYEQVLAYEMNEDGDVVEVKHKFPTFDFPWVLCER
jgi:hypothetical protein